MHMIRGLPLAAIILAAPLAAAAPDDLNTDCALYGECGAVEAESPIAAPAEAEGEEAARPGVRRGGKTRGGFTMRSESATKAGVAKPVVAVPSTRPTQRTKAQIVSPKTAMAVAGQMQAEAVRVGQQITFVSGSAELQPGSKLVAQKLAASMLRADKLAVRFRIEGHTDAVGSRELNMDLSKRRADAVVSYLGSLGVAVNRLEPAGHGFDKPLPGVSIYAAANRRVVAEAIK